MHGHAIEGRLCAEDPAKGFMPSIGRIDLFDAPQVEGLRLETGVETGSEISPFYDSMIAKLITWGPDRETAIERLEMSLEELEILGPKTNAAFLDRLLDHSDVVDGLMDTGLIGRELRRLTLSDPDELKRGIDSAVASLMSTRREMTTLDPWSADDAFQLGPPRRQPVSATVDGEVREFDVAWAGAGMVSVDGGQPVEVGENMFSTLAAGRSYGYAENVRYAVAWPTFDIDQVADGESADTIRAPINGRLAKIFVTEGMAILKGEKIAVVEAMKMEHVLHAARDGTIAKIAAKEGAQVTQGTLIASLAEA